MSRCQQAPGESLADVIRRQALNAPDLHSECVQAQLLAQQESDFAMEALTRAAVVIDELRTNERRMKGVMEDMEAKHEQGKGIIKALEEKDRRSAQREKQSDKRTKTLEGENQKLRDSLANMKRINRELEHEQGEVERAKEEMAEKWRSSERTNGGLKAALAESAVQEKQYERRIADLINEVSGMSAEQQTTAWTVMSKVRPIVNVQSDGI